MKSKATVPLELTLKVSRDCLCLRVQRASRTIARMFDEAFRPHGLNSFQFSLLITLNRPTPLTIGKLAQNLAMDRTTTTANLKPLERRGLLNIRRDEGDPRARQISLTDAGRALLAKCIADWQAVNTKVRNRVSPAERSALYAGLERIAEARP